jgi:hypothetical protein
MAKPVKRPVGRPKIDEDTDTVATRIPVAMKEALAKLAKTNKRTLSSELYRILEEALVESGHWTTATADDDE